MKQEIITPSTFTSTLTHEIRQQQASAPTTAYFVNNPKEPNILLKLRIYLPNRELLEIEVGYQDIADADVDADADAVVYAEMN